jgi:hypothetical protein
MKKPNHPFAGTWKLISWINTDSGGNQTFPYGKNPSGYLIYTADGYMAAQIMNPDRQQGNPDFPAEPAFSQTLPDSDRLTAYNTALSYCGTYSYSLETQRVVHHVKISLIPGWSGKDQPREFEFRDGKLILGSLRAKLIWERANPYA